MGPLPLCFTPPAADQQLPHIYELARQVYERKYESCTYTEWDSIVNMYMYYLLHTKRVPKSKKDSTLVPLTHTMVRSPSTGATSPAFSPKSLSSSAGDYIAPVGGAYQE